MAQLVLFDFQCNRCGMTTEHFTTRREANRPYTCVCGGRKFRVLSPVKGRVKGRADGKDRSDADRFTADMLGIPEKELPSGLRRGK